MSDAATPSERPAVARRGRGATTTALVTILVALMLLLVAAFLLRGMIARQALEAWLREAGVGADISITDVGPRGAKAKADLGDAAARDLSIGDVELDYDLVAPWFGRPAGVRVRAVRLRDVVVRARLRDGRLSFGRLDKLIEQLSARPRGEPAPLPDIDLQHGALILATDAGELRLSGSGLVKDGALQRFDGTLAPATLRQAALRAQITGGGVTVRRVGGGYDARLRATASKASFGGIAGGRLAVDLSAVGAASAEKGFIGRVRLDATAAELKAGEQHLSGSRIALDAPSLSVVPANGGVRSSGAATMRVSSTRATLGEAVAASSPQAQVTLDRHAGIWTKDRNSVDAAFLLNASAASLTTSDLQLGAARLEAVGSIAGDPANPSLNGHGSLSSRGRLTEASARRLAASLPLVAQEPGYRQAFLAAARDFRLEAPAASLTWRDGAVRIALARPASVRTASGARLTLASRGAAAVYASQGSGALDATLTGGGLPQISAEVADWRWRGDAVEARGRVRGAFDLTPLDDVAIDAAGRLRLAGEAVSFTADRCATFSVRHIELDANDLTNVKGQACPTAAPLFVAQGGGWRARAAFRAAEFAAPAAEVRVRAASGTLDLREQAGLVRLAAADVIDIGAIPRFSPLRFSGSATQRGQLWTAQAAAALPDGVRLATAQGRHDLARGVGAATFDTGLLSFAEDGFQPERVTPMARTAGRVVGRAQFQGQADWSPSAAHSSGRLTLDGLDFDSPAGRIAGATGEIAFASLAPLTTPPDQRVRAAKLAFFTPLTDIDATFALDPEQLRLASLTAKAAGGVLTLEPMSVRLADGSTRGALVLDDIDLNQIVASTNLAEKIRLNAVVDGRLPFAVGPEGLRVENGRLASVEPGRLYIARDMLGGVSTSSSPGAPAPTTVNAIQDFAYQAMENLSFETLVAEVASRDDGRLGLVFQIKGRHDPEVAERARLTLLDVLRGRAFERRIPLPKGTPIDLTLDSSVNFDELVKAYAEAWRQKVEETP